MIIKIDKQKVVEAAEKKLEWLNEASDDYFSRKRKLIEKLNDTDTSRIDVVAISCHVFTSGYGSPYFSEIDKVRAIIKSCNLSEDQTVTITDEDVALLGL